MGFVHLQVKSAFDLLSSTASLDALIAKAKACGFDSLAITDKNALYGAVNFYEKCQAAQIKPIIGMTVSVYGYIDTTRSYELLLLAETTAGYQNLLKIASAIQTQDEKVLPLNWLKAYGKGLIAISPGATGEVEHLLMDSSPESAAEVTAYWQSIFSQDSFFLSIQAENPRLKEAVQNFSSAQEIDVVLTKDVQYLEAGDVRAQEVLMAIRDNRTVDYEKLPLAGPNFLASADEMAASLTTDFEQQAYEQTAKIAARCQVVIPMGLQLLPRFPLRSGSNASAELEKLALAGLQERNVARDKRYLDRLHYELDVITKMGFQDYFLIVWDVMRFAREVGILTGPGRGSAAGSLVSYALRITDVDPIAYRLLFERFLNPERVTMPDIDLDFPDNRRDEVIRYVVDKYGADHVAQIGTFGTLAAKAAIRDTARTFGLNAVLLSEWSKMIPSQLGITLKAAREQNPRLNSHIHSSHVNEMIWEIAEKLEGLPRHISTHAAGIVINDEPLVTYTPVQSGSGDARLTQYAMGELERIGLLKMDFLGLRNLSLLDRILKIVNYNRTKPLTLADIPLEDKATLNLFQKGDTTGVFQFESSGIRRVLRKLKPTSFEDIVAVDALYRPGPMEQIDTFIARKHGEEKIVYPHEDLKQILDVTYGVIVYQEQIIQVANRMAGFSLGEADILRRAVSKKKREVLDGFRKQFVSGANANGYAETTANEVYDLIVRFANYGFNRSHAAAYSKIAFQLAYLKAHYPAAFMSSLLSSVFGNDEKIAQYVTEAKNYGIEMLAPSVNKSGYYFQVEQENKIRYSLRIIRKVPNKFILELLNVRKQGGPFADFFDFCERMPNNMLTHQVLEALIYAGAFDEFGKDRAVLMASIETGLQYTDLFGESEAGMNLFATEDSFLKSMKPKYREADPMPMDTKLDKEKEFTGQYVSAHPVTSYQQVAQTLAVTELADVTNGNSYAIAVYVHQIKTVRTKKGSQMCFLTISDASKEFRAVVFPEVYAKAQAIIQKGAILLLKVKVEDRNGEMQAVVNSIQDMKTLEPAKRLFLKIATAEELNMVKKILLQNAGDHAVIVYHAGEKQTLQLQNKFSVNGSENLLYQLKQTLGTENVVWK